MKERTLRVEGMTCEHCVMTIKRALSTIEGVSRVDVSLSAGTVKVELDRDVPFEDLKRAIEEWGYRVVS
ncbi:MAG TPA: copper chaperone [Aquifex aeolicus]|uniref:Copper chaperone n=1 Tax=Aquifex aeolicus TaxID=63363 RepID=A0A7C5L7P5_AQUAO|nr:copper chaperone [Aquifex aeolicus]